MPRFLAIVDVRFRYHSNHVPPVKWCLNEKVELLCKLAMPRRPVKWYLKGRIALQAGHASPVKWCLNEKVELLCKLAIPRLSIALQAGYALQNYV